jgi:hypothetical protein
VQHREEAEFRAEMMRIYLRPQRETRRTEANENEGRQQSVAHSARGFPGQPLHCDFHGKKAIEWDDSKIKDAGKVAVWTKADSVTLFDDFAYGSK